MIMQSGIVDIEEDFVTGYGGQKVCETFEKEGKKAKAQQIY